METKPTHPGEVLREKFMKPYGLSAYRVGKALRVPRMRIRRIVREEAAITVDTAIRLSRYFGNSPEFWLNLQKRYDVHEAERKLRKTLASIKPHDGRRT